MTSISDSSVVSSAWEQRYVSSSKKGKFNSINNSSNSSCYSHRDFDHNRSPLTELKLRVHTLRDEVERNAALHHKTDLTCADHRRELTMLQEKERALFNSKEDRLRTEVQRVLEMNNELRERLEQQRKKEAEELHKTLEAARAESSAKVDTLETTLASLQSSWEMLKVNTERAEEMQGNVQRELTEAIHTRTQLQHEVKEMQRRVKQCRNLHKVHVLESKKFREEEEEEEQEEEEQEEENNVAGKTQTRNEKIMSCVHQNNTDNNKEVYLNALPINASTSTAWLMQQGNSRRKERQGHQHEESTQEQENTECERCNVDRNDYSANNKLQEIVSICANNLEKKQEEEEEEEEEEISSCESFEEQLSTHTPFMLREMTSVPTLFIPAGVTDPARATSPASHHIASLVSTVKHRNTYRPRSFYARHHINVELCESVFRHRRAEWREQVAARYNSLVSSNAAPSLLPIKQMNSYSLSEEERTYGTSSTEGNRNENTNKNEKLHESNNNNNNDALCNEGNIQDHLEQKQKVYYSTNKKVLKSAKDLEPLLRESTEDCMNGYDNDKDDISEEELFNNINTYTNSSDNKEHSEKENAHRNRKHKNHRNQSKNNMEKHNITSTSVEQLCKTLVEELVDLQHEYAECQRKLYGKQQQLHRKSCKNNVESNVMIISRQMRKIMQIIDRKVAQLQTLRQLKYKMQHNTHLHKTLRALVKENNYCDALYGSVVQLLKGG